MGWFGPKLEPGERVLLRAPPAWLSPAFGILWLSLPPSAAGSAQLVGAFLGFDVSVDGLMLAMYAVVCVVFAVLWFRLFRWRFAVTDRRLLVRDGRGRYEEIPLAEIDDVTRYRLGDGLFVAGHGRKIIVPCKEKTATRICAAIAAAKGAARMRATIAAAKEAPA